MTTRLILLRHAPTDWNEARLLQGRTDRPLSEEGRRQASRWRLPDRAGEAGDTRRFVSPLRRCVETAVAMGLDPRPEPALIEASWGEWEGRRLADIRAADPDGVAAREAAGLDFHPPGGESARDVQARLLPFLARQSALGGDVVGVTHRGVLRALYALCVGWDMTGPPPDKMRPACAHAFLLDSQGFPRVQELNIPLDEPESDPENGL